MRSVVLPHTLFNKIVISSIFLAGIFTPNIIQAQCPTVVAVMVDACGTEQLNEFIIIHSGGGFNTSQLQLDYDANNNIIGAENNDVNTNNGNIGVTPCGITTGNIGAYAGCSNLIAVGAGVDIPANSIVIFQNSSGSTAGLYNFSALCGMGECVYVVASSCTRSAGGFTNGAASGSRTTIFSIGGSCNQSIVYNQVSLTGGNGAYYLPLSNTYGNAGCVVPPSPPAPSTPTFNNPGNQTICGSYALPAITGTNLSGNEGYYTAANGLGTQLMPGQSITTTTTIFIYDPSSACSPNPSFTITITPGTTPTFTQVPPICSGGSFTLPATSNNGINGSWLPAVNNTTTTTYTFTPNMGECATPQTMTVTVNSNVTPTFTQVPPICSGETFSLPATSNNGINGSWSPAINTTNTTTYTFTPTVGQCAATQTMTVTVNSNVTPTFTQVPPICSGETFSLPATSNNGINGSWSPAINTTNTTTYTFTPTVGQCAATQTMTVTVNSNVTPTFTQVPPICSGETFSLPATSNNGIN
ncbi:MAG TPA: hypothetical protein PLZ12_02725, partial [Saprospiraceae bacterium]|nr:hypothetical protein [Saprospiraceae bacterium]